MPISCLFTSPPAITTLLLAVTSKRVAENTEWVASPDPSEGGELAAQSTGGECAQPTPPSNLEGVRGS